MTKNKTTLNRFDPFTRFFEFSIFNQLNNFVEFPLLSFNKLLNIGSECVRYKLLL